MRQMSATELDEYLKTTSPLPVLLDVREEWEFQTCHIQGSLHIPMNVIADHLDKLGKDQTIVLICHHGMRSLQVAHFLESRGYEHIINLKGGIDAWARDVDNTMPVY